MGTGVDFPCAGVAARRWRRFEEELREWLASPEGRFVAYCAERDRAHLGTSQALEPAQPAHSV